MKILLDTHILLWAVSNDVRLPEKAKKLIENMENDIYYSMLSLWEVEIKYLAHPNAMPVSAKELSEYCVESGYQKLPFRESHIFAMAGLEREEGTPAHKDPFDRMLICQASVENMIFVTHDSLIAGYREPCILVV